MKTIIGDPTSIAESGLNGIVIAEVYMTLNEPRQDKTNKMSVRPAKTQISLGIRPV